MMKRAAAFIAAVGLSFAMAAPAVAQQTGTRASSFAYDPATGLLTQEVVEPDLAEYRLQTDYTIDAFGNKTAVTVSGADIATRTSSSTFDARGQFAVTQSNALNQSESWAYDGRYGVPVSHTGPNGLTTSWEYDGFGRRTLELRADGTRTTWSYRYCSGIAGGTDSCPDGATFLVETNVLGADGVTPIAPKAIAYHDKLGRPIAADTEGFDGSTIRSVTEYDTLGRKKRSSRPYFLSGGTPVYQSTDYDVLSRPVQKNLFDGTTLTLSYHALTTTVTNALGVIPEMLFRTPASEHDRDNKLRLVVAVPIAAEWGEAMEQRFGFRFIQAFGGTEMSIVCYTTLDDPLVPGMAGHVWDDLYDVRVVDPHTDAAMPRGELGEIVVRPQYLTGELHLEVDAGAFGGQGDAVPRVPLNPEDNGGEQGVA